MQHPDFEPYPPANPHNASYGQLKFVFQHDRVKAFEMLLDQPWFDINRPVVMGKKPLELVIGHDSRKIFALILSKQGVDMMVGNQDSRKHVLHALMPNVVRVDMLHIFLRVLPQYNMNLRDKFGNTPLHYACGNGGLEKVEILLKCTNIDVNTSNCWGETPVLKAIRGTNVAGCLEVFKLLRACPAVQLDKPQFFRYALWGLYCERHAMLDEFVRHGPDGTCWDELGNTPLISCIRTAPDKLLGELAWWLDEKRKQGCGTEFFDRIGIRTRNARAQSPVQVAELQGKLSDDETTKTYANNLVEALKRCMDA